MHDTNGHEALPNISYQTCNVDVASRTYVPCCSFLCALACHVESIQLSHHCELIGNAVKNLVETTLVLWSMRGTRVRQMLNALTNDGIRIDHSDQVIIDAYVKGEISDQDILAHACQFATLLSYQEWIETKREKGCNGKQPIVPVEQIVSEIEACIRRKYSEVWTSSQFLVGKL